MTADASDCINMGRFSLLAQAIHLLERVLSLYRETGSTAFVDTRESEVRQLDRALNALLVFTVREGSQRGLIVCCQSAICYRYKIGD